MDTIKTVLYNTVHRNKKPVAQIADETGISANYLYRAGLPVDESGVRFPVDYLVPLMKSTKDFSVLRHLARLCGFFLVREPRYKASKGQEIDILSDYQGSTADAVNRLKRFLDNPSLETYQETLHALDEVMEKTVGAQKFVTKKMRGQTELDV